MREINLTQGKVALVDDSDYERVNQYKWCAEKKSETRWYARRGFTIAKKTRKFIPMQRFILGEPPEGFVIDHINRNGLDNRRENLRVVTRRENSCNANKNKKSEMYGVAWIAQKNKWQAVARVNGRVKHIGFFKEEKDAHYAYCLFTGVVLRD